MVSRLDRDRGARRNAGGTSSVLRFAQSTFPIGEGAKAFQSLKPMTFPEKGKAFNLSNASAEPPLQVSPLFYIR